MFPALFLQKFKLEALPDVTASRVFSYEQAKEEDSAPSTSGKAVEVPWLLVCSFSKFRMLYYLHTARLWVW